MKQISISFLVKDTIIYSIITRMYLKGYKNVAFCMPQQFILLQRKNLKKSKFLWKKIIKFSFCCWFQNNKVINFDIFVLLSQSMVCKLKLDELINVMPVLQMTYKRSLLHFYVSRVENFCVSVFFTLFDNFNFCLLLRVLI